MPQGFLSMYSLLTRYVYALILQVEKPKTALPWIPGTFSKEKQDVIETEVESLVTPYILSIKLLTLF